MRVLLAFDKFKDAISAGEACDIAGRAVRSIHPDWTLDLCPLTDGGDGFETILGKAISAQPIELKVSGPRGGLVTAGLSLARFAQFPETVREHWLSALDLAPDSKIAILEMARASGIARLPPESRDPWQTTTYGTGQLIRAAAELGANAIVLGLGGSATNDVGIGALAALGLDFRGASGEKFRPPMPRHGRAIVQIEGQVYPSIPPIILATDVTNPLLGLHGATKSYGPQKGLTAAMLPEMESWVSYVAGLLREHSNAPADLAEKPGTGAAGGIAFGLVCAARARLVPGYEFTAACLDLPRRIGAADLILTGEGRFDASSFSGKGPGRVVSAAKEFEKEVHVFAGQVEVTSEGKMQLHALSATGVATPASLQATGENLGNEIKRVLKNWPAV